MEQTCVNWSTQNQGAIQRLRIELFPLLHRSLSLLFRSLLLIPFLLFCGVASQSWSQTAPATSPTATPEEKNLLDASSASHGAAPSVQAPFPWLRGGVPANPQNSHSMNSGDRFNYIVEPDFRSSTPCHEFIYGRNAHEQRI